MSLEAFERRRIESDPAHRIGLRALLVELVAAAAVDGTADPERVSLEVGPAQRADLAPTGSCHDGKSQEEFQIGIALAGQGEQPDDRFRCRQLEVLRNDPRRAGSCRRIHGDPAPFDRLVQESPNEGMDMTDALRAERCPTLSSPPGQVRVEEGSEVSCSDRTHLRRTELGKGSAGRAKARTRAESSVRVSVRTERAIAVPDRRTYRPRSRSNSDPLRRAARSTRLRLGASSRGWCAAGIAWTSRLHARGRPSPARRSFPWVRDARAHRKWTADSQGIPKTAFAAGRSERVSLSPGLLQRPRQCRNSGHKRPPAEWMCQDIGDRRPGEGLRWTCPSS
jgi:hypothetical protein